MKKGQLRQLVLSLGAGIAAFLVLALALHWNFLFSAALGVGIYLGLWFLLAPKADPITLYFAQQPDGGEMQALMEEAARDLRAIRSAAGRITDVRTHEDALALTETGDRLYRYLREHPEKIPSANRFLTYYLDTVGRILGQYVKFQEAGLGTSEVREFQRKVRAILPKLKTGFEAQLSQLMASERFDAEADMKVMEGGHGGPAEHGGIPMGSKSKWIGLIILLAVIGAAAVYLLLGGGPQPEPAVLRGYVGGEKIGLLEDEAVQDILDRNYGLTLDYAKAGSLDMVTADHEGRNFLFPSSQTALEYYQQLYGAPDRSQIVFNTPIVLYTHRPILEAFQKEGLVTERDGVYYMDMAGLVAEIEAGTAWADLGLPELYGTVAVNTTDPVRSNSGNMFAGLLANVLCGGVADEDSVEAVLPRLQAIFEKLGYMEASSSDLFDQFLKTGMGAKPMIAGYENQLLEFAVENPEDWEQLKDDIVLIYPTPTVWSSHIYIALDEAGEAGIDALMDEEIQRLAWENHGFRTEVSGTGADEDHFGVPHLAAEITQVAAMPSYAAMEKIIAALS